METTNILRPQMNLYKNPMKYSCFVVFVRHNSAEIWRFRYGLTLVIGTLKIIARTGVFLRVVCALKPFIKYFPLP
jgi:hypothetical protein